jgi:hypothetical protein
VSAAQGYLDAARDNAENGAARQRREDDRRAIGWQFRFEFAA